MLAHQDALLDLRLLDVPFFVHSQDALAVLRRNHLVILHLLHLLRNLVIVSLLELHDLTSALASLINFLSRLHLFLFKKRNTVC